MMQRILIIDDVPKDVLHLIGACIDSMIPFVFIDASEVDESLYGNFSDVTFVYLDVDLNYGEESLEIGEKLRYAYETLKDYISDNSSILSLKLFSGHADSLSSSQATRTFEDVFEKRLLLNPVEVIGKNINIDDLNKHISELEDSLKILKYSGLFLKVLIESSNSIFSRFIAGISDEDFGEFLRKLNRVESGLVTENDDYMMIVKNSMITINKIAESEFSNKILLDPDFYPKIDFSKFFSDTSKKCSILDSDINSRLNIEHSKPELMMKKSGCLYKVDEVFNDIDKKSVIHNYFELEDIERGIKKLDKLKCTPIVLDITQDCDFYQRKAFQNLFVYGIMIKSSESDYQIKKTAKGVKHFLESKKIKIDFCIHLDKDEYKIVFFSRFLFFLKKEEIITLNPIFNISSRSLIDIRNIVLNHHKRIGVDSI